MIFKNLFAWLIIAFTFTSLSVNAGGISAENKSKMLDSLKSYQKTKKKKAFSTGEKQASESCSAEKYSTQKSCLELKYINDGYYKVNITYEVEHSESEDLPARLKSESWEFKNSDLELYLNEWSDPYLREYVGQNYNQYNNIKLVSLNNDYLIVELEVINADELEMIMQDNRIVGVYHIGNPESALDEIAD